MAKKHVILFAGTTEGRILANWLDEQVLPESSAWQRNTVQSFWKKKCL